MKFSIHEDGWSETLAGLKYIISKIEELENEGDTFNSVIMLRLVFISCSYLAEQVFNKSVQKFAEDKLNSFGNSEEEQEDKTKFIIIKDGLSLNKVGISKAMKEWPTKLTGKKLNLGSGPIQALKEITNKRNDLIHKLNDIELYPNPSKTAKQVLFTAVEACKAIENHFFPDSDFTYIEWLKEYPVEHLEFFKNN